MKRLQWLWAPVGLLLAVGVTTSRAENFVITSFERGGQIVFTPVQGATNYQVSVASSLTGAWSVVVESIPPAAANSITTTVSLAGASAFYRVFAFTNSGTAPSGMVLVPAGVNTGTDPDFGAYSLTNAEAFYMDKYEVTNAQWDQVYDWAVTNGYTFDNAGSGKATDHPVHSVSWYDCVKWCNARNQKDGREPVYYTDAGLTQVYKTGEVSEPYVKSLANGYCLPTDVQLEYAARGGVANRRFPWGDSDTIQHARANYYSDGGYGYDTSSTRGYHPTYNDGTYPYTSPVGSFATNGYGLCDMAGNVWEWCYDWYPEYDGSYRVYRGGSWNSYARHCRVAGRSGSGPGSSYYSIGFRAVLHPGQ